MGFFLWHGTAAVSAEKCAKQGLDERLAASGLYGAGIYFAEQSCKSHQYTRKGLTSSGEHCMFYMRVALGNPHITGAMLQQRRMEDIDPSGKTDCVIATKGPVAGHFAGRQEHTEFIVYDRYQCYPEFIIYYKPA